MSGLDTVSRVLLVDRLLAVRQAVDEALRALGEEGDTPPSPSFVPQPADPLARASDPLPDLCKHNWVEAGFGTVGKMCSKCGVRG
jgi:hypothetical protein